MNVAQSTEPQRANRTYTSFTELIEACRGLPPLRTSVVYPCDQVSLSGVAAATSAGIIQPTLIGPEARIRALAASLAIDLGAMELFDVPEDPHAAAERAVGMAAVGAAEALFKGSLETSVLASEVVRAGAGIRGHRRVSHVFVMQDARAFSGLLLLTDAAINIAPTLEEKVDIVQNAVDLAHALGVALPKVAILSATEMVRPSIPSTTDAAALCKMADRGQITGAILDGPLAFDEAMSREAADIKHIRSAVAGDPDVLVVPDLDAGNMLAKELRLFAQGQEAGIAVGARVPIILTSRSDDVSARLASCAVAALYAHAFGMRAETTH
jgi:phosphate acetyltransferase